MIPSIGALRKARRRRRRRGSALGACGRAAPACSRGVRTYSAAAGPGIWRATPGSNAPVDQAPQLGLGLRFHRVVAGVECLLFGVQLGFAPLETLQARFDVLPPPLEAAALGVPVGPVRLVSDRVEVLIDGLLLALERIPLGL